MVIKVIIVFILEDKTAIDWVFSGKSSGLVLKLSVESPRLATEDVVAVMHEECVMVSNMN
jgi:hypothetical protein